MPLTNYAEAIRQALEYLLRNDSRTFIIGQGVQSPWYVGDTMTDLDKEFGRNRVIDSPVSENATTGAAIGAALSGMRPIVVHPRMDFMLLAADQIVNEAANWNYIFGGQASVPLVIRAVINRGGEQGAQHSQAMHAWFAHIPGLKVVMPSTPSDAKGLLLSAAKDPNPVIYIEDRWLYGEEGDVPASYYETPIGKAKVIHEGVDVTIVASSYMTKVVKNAIPQIQELSIEPEVIDLGSIKPWDKDTVLRSVEKTGRLVVADSGWLTAGFSAEIAAHVARECFDYLLAPIGRIGLMDVPAPTSITLEQAYYQGTKEVVQNVINTIEYSPRTKRSTVPRNPMEAD